MSRTRNARHPRRRLVRSLAVASGLALAAAACSSGADEGGGDDGGTGTGEPQSGGDLTVLLDSGFAGGWATGLDPAMSNTVGANLPQNSAIFGGLFTLEPADGGESAELVPNQAESYEWSDDGLTLTVTLREGIEFSDGTEMDAEDVVWNWIRDFSAGSSSAPTIQLNMDMEQPDLSDEFMQSLWDSLPEDVDRDLVNQRLGAIRAVDDYTVEMHLGQVNGALVNGFPTTNLNLIASPDAYAEMGGQEFRDAPVGAGPFTVASNRQNERLELERNDNYFKDGLPYLDSLNFQAVGGDQVAYQTLMAGQGDVIEGLSEVNLIEEAQNNPDLEVHLGAPTSPYVIQLNARKPPFDDKRAREAIYYATDFGAINEGLFNGQGEMSQSFTASGGLFHMPEIDGYREYDPDQAEQIVEELGGLEVTLNTTDTGVARQVTTALQTQWQEVGMDVQIEAEALNDVITTFTEGDWESILQTAGAWDPSVGIGVGIRFGSTSPYSGTPLPEGADNAQQALQEGLTTELDDILADAVATTDEDERQEAYRQAAEYIAEEAYGPFGPAFQPAQVMRPEVHGPGLDVPIPALAVNQGVLYDRVWMEQQ